VKQLSPTDADVDLRQGERIDLKIGAKPLCPSRTCAKCTLRGILILRLAGRVHRIDASSKAVAVARTAMSIRPCGCTVSRETPAAAPCIGLAQTGPARRVVSVCCARSRPRPRRGPNGSNHRRAKRMIVLDGAACVRNRSRPGGARLTRAG